MKLPHRLDIRKVKQPECAICGSTDCGYVVNFWLPRGQESSTRRMSGKDYPIPEVQMWCCKEHVPESTAIVLGRVGLLVETNNDQQIPIRPVSTRDGHSEGEGNAATQTGH